MHSNAFASFVSPRVVCASAIVGFSLSLQQNPYAVTSELPVDVRVPASFTADDVTSEKLSAVTDGFSLTATVILTGTTVCEPEISNVIVAS